MVMVNIKVWDLNASAAREHIFLKFNSTIYSAGAQQQMRKRVCGHPACQQTDIYFDWPVHINAAKKVNSAS